MLAFIPSLFTTLNLLLGFLSIVFTARGMYEPAAWLINFAVLCDGMDGKLARLTQAETAYGYELDTLADIVSFGVAPALLLQMAFVNSLGIAGSVSCFLYLFAGAFRLVRFNVQNAGDRSHGYSGLPIPISAMALAGLMLFKYRAVIVFHPIIWLILMVILSLFMISHIPYQWPQLRSGSLKNRMISAGICIAVLLMAIQPRWFLFPFLTFYVLKGAVIVFWAYARQWQVKPLRQL